MLAFRGPLRAAAVTRGRSIYRRCFAASRGRVLDATGFARRDVKGLGCAASVGRSFAACRARGPIHLCEGSPPVAEGFHDELQRRVNALEKLRGEALLRALLDIVEA